MKKIFLIALISSLGLAFSIKDNQVLKILVLNKLSEYTTKKYPEKIYIQTDKPYYTAGDDLWFNTYLVNGITHRRTAKSKVIYVELINDRDSIISERKLFTESLSIEGDFKLPTDLKEGKYLMRAYTNYMRNTAEDFFFKKEIQIFSLYSETENDKLSETKVNLELPEVDFYPEGGYLINGLSNKIAVKIKEAELTAHPISGRIEDNLGNKVADFNTLEFGLGSFSFTPEEGKEYSALIAFDDEDIVYPLPTPLSQGYTINTSIKENEVLININTNKKEGLKNTFIIGQQRGQAVFDYTQPKDTKSMLLKIPKDDLIEGVLDIVVFNESTNPVAERLVFIKKEEEITVSVKKTNSSSLGLRDKVNLEIEVKDKTGKLVPSTLSLSVTDGELISTNINAENIKTWLLLNSDLRGKIKSPNYFFEEGDNVKKNELLDLVMMTHGWRRFVWQDFLQQDILPKYKVEDGIYIVGNTVSTEYPYSNKISETKLTFRKNGFYQEAQETDEEGYFAYGPFRYNDTIVAFLQAGEGISSEDPNFKSTNIILRKPQEKPRVLRDLITAPFTKKQNLVEEAYIKKSRKLIVSNFEFDDDRELLEEVLLKGKLKSKEEIKNIERVKRARASSPSHRILMGDMGRQGGADFMWLLESIPGVRIWRNMKNIFDPEGWSILLYGKSPKIYLDNVELTLKEARGVTQANIDFIDVIKPGSASKDYGSSGNGIIAIYTKKGSRDVDALSHLSKGSINFKSAGFYSARKFYAPDYSSNLENANRKDIRTTLHWQPNIFTNGYDNANVSFYTSDEKGRFLVEVEGITDAGIPIRTTSILEVK